jgi:hypothetical protein
MGRLIRVSHRSGVGDGDHAENGPLEKKPDYPSVRISFVAQPN